MINDSDFQPFMLKDDPIYVAGHRGLVGSAICRCMAREGYRNIITCGSQELDLRDPVKTLHFYEATRPRYVFFAAARVGGILANNTYPAEFIRDNLAIQSSVIEASRITGVKRLLFLGSSCIYPKLAPQPISEDSFMTGPLEPTNRPYAIAKIAGIEMCWSYNRQFGTQYLAAMPTNLYGPRDCFDLSNSHVLPALILKTIEAIRRGSHEVVVWGTGSPRREFLYSEDLAKACVFLMNLGEGAFGKLLSEDKVPIINIGTGEDLTIRELAETVSTVLNFKGTLSFDLSKPDGTPQKLLDVTRMRTLGWSPEVSLKEGIQRVVQSMPELLTLR